MSSTERAPAQHVPAWKRLGLKLKQPAGGASAAGPASEPANGSSGVGQPGGSTGHKRKIDAPPSTDASPYKRFRGDDQHGAQKNGILSSSSKPKKSVKFGDTPTKNDAVSPAAARTNNTTPKGKPTKDTPKKDTPKKAKGPTKKQKEPAPTDLKPALEYLRQWKTSRENWKFNKNHQSTLIKHLFDKDAIPSTDIDTFYEYLQDLKGFVRTRLREQAMEVQMQDVSDGSAAFPDDMMDLDDKQEQYAAILADILRRKREQGPKRKFFNETQYVAESQDGEVIIRRVVKRMRAEIVMDELSDGETTDTTTTSMSSKTVTNSDNNTTIMTNGDKQPQLSNTTAKRRRKLRTNMDDSSSSESESDNDSDTSSSGSSDDSEDEEEGQRDEDDTSSSSSSSSSEGEDEDSDDSDEN